MEKKGDRGETQKEERARGRGDSSLSHDERWGQKIPQEAILQIFMTAYSV